MSFRLEKSANNDLMKYSSDVGKLFFYFQNSSNVPLPGDLTDYPDWFNEIAKQEGVLGPATWTVQTCLVLKSRGVNCELVSEIPTSGVIVAHYDHVPRGLHPNRKLY